MSAKVRNSIVSRLRWLVSVFVVVAVGMAVAAFWAYESFTMEKRVAEAARPRAFMLADGLADALARADGSEAARQMEALRFDREVRGAAVYDAKGVRLARYEAAALAESYRPSTPPETWVGVKGDLLAFMVPVKSGEKTLGQLWLSVRIPGWAERWSSHALGLGITVVLLLALGSVIASSVRRTITKPLVELAGVAERISERKNYSLEAVAKGADEIGNLARAFDDMLKAISQRDQTLMESKARLAGQNLGLIRQSKAQRDHHGNLKAQFTAINEITAAVLAVERIGIWLISRDGRTLKARDVFTQSTGLHLSGEEMQACNFPDYFFGLQTLRSIEAEDALTHRWTREMAEAYLKPNRIGAVLNIPIRWRDELVGVLCIEHVGGRRAWHADEVAFGLSTMDRIVLILESEEARLAELQLRESEKRFRAIIDQARDAIFTLSVDGEILGLNAAVEQITGWERASWMGLNFEEVIHDDDREVARKHFAEVLAGKNPPWFPLKIYSKRHEVLTLEFAVSARQQGGKIVGLLGIGRDVTERTLAGQIRERLEAQLRQAQKMDAIGMLAGGIAHDFNNVLTAIIGHAQLVEMDLAKGQPAGGGVSAILAASNRAKDLVRQILTFSRRQEQKQAPVSLELIVKEAQLLLRPSLPSTVEIKLSLAPALPQIQADPTQLHQVVMNLATNGFHALDDQPGVIELSVDLVHVDQAMVNQHPQLRPGEFVRLGVSDTGCGMDAEMLEHIFEPFFTTKAPGKGTGLGLAVVHGIVRQHNGSVVVYSQPGKGTQFLVYFPVLAKPDSRPPMEKSALPAVPGHGERILLVDDEAFIVTVAARILRNAGYRVDVASHPSSALTLFKTAPVGFELLITDYTMPGMKGTVLAQEIRKLRPELPVILMTGFAGAIPELALLELTPREILQKPFTAEGLLGAVNRVFAESDSTRVEL